MRISDWSSDVCSSDLLDCDAGPQHLRTIHDYLLPRLQPAGDEPAGSDRARRGDLAHLHLVFRTDDEDGRIALLVTRHGDLGHEQTVALRAIDQFGPYEPSRKKQTARIRDQRRSEEQKTELQTIMSSTSTV